MYTNSSINELSRIKNILRLATVQYLEFAQPFWNVPYRREIMKLQYEFGIAMNYRLIFHNFYSFFFQIFIQIVQLLCYYLFQHFFLIFDEFSAFLKNFYQIFTEILMIFNNFSSHFSSIFIYFSTFLVDLWSIFKTFWPI